MSRLPPEYFFFIARGILLNNKHLVVPYKETYTDDELAIIFCCRDISELKKKLAEIETKTIEQLDLPEKDFYTLDDLASHLNIEPEVPVK